MLKKGLLFVVTAGVIFLFTACANKEPALEPTVTTSETEIAPQTEIPTQEPAKTQTATEAATEAPTETVPHRESAAPEGAQPLSEEEIAELTELFTQKFAGKGEEIPDINWYNMLMTCDFEDPTLVNLRQLFSNGVLRPNPPTIGDEEREFLKTREQLRMQMDVYKIPREIMEEVLQTYLGISLEEAEGVGLDQMAYLTETDCYYCNGTGFPLADPFTITDGWHTPDGEIVMLYNIEEMYDCQMTLIPMDDGYQVESNLFLNKDQFQ